LSATVSFCVLNGSTVPSAAYGCGMNFFGAESGSTLGFTSRFCCSIHWTSSS
jgi:hypothetical protein